MQSAYELLNKYAKVMAEQEYSVGEDAKLFIETDDGVFSTKLGADLLNLTLNDIQQEFLEKLPMSDKGMKAMILSQTPYCQECLSKMRPFKPSLDDMAQIIGPAVVIVDGRITNRSAENDIEDALSKAGGCFVIDGVDMDGYATGYTVTIGRTLYEAVVAMTVLEKSAEVTIRADKIGGAKYISPIETRLMRANYRKNYSKAETQAKADEMQNQQVDASSLEDDLYEQADVSRAGCHNKLPARDTSDCSDSFDFPADSASETLTDEVCCASAHEQALRTQLAEYGRRLVQTGLVQGTWGNLSVRLDDEYMLVTPSGLDYMRLAPADMVKVNIETLEYEGDLKPTSEKGLHAEIYKTREDIGSVIHTHSKYCSVFAAAERDMPITDPDAQETFGAGVNLAKYALPGTKKLMLNTVRALDDNFGCIMSHHGMIACGEDLEAAFDNCGKLEQAGKDYLE